MSKKYSLDNNIQQKDKILEQWLELATQKK